MERIEDIVDAACDSKQPGFLKAMETYLKRVNGLALQTMRLRTGQSRHAYLGLIQNVATTSGRAEQDRLLERIGVQLASVEVRLLDPANFKLRSMAQRRKAVTVTIMPRPSWQARRDAAMQRAENEAFAVSNDGLATRLRHDLRLFQHPIRLSTLSAETARDVVGNMQLVEAARSAPDKDLRVRKLPLRFENNYYVGDDYEIGLSK